MKARRWEWMAFLVLLGAGIQATATFALAVLGYYQVAYLELFLPGGVMVAIGTGVLLRDVRDRRRVQEGA